MESLQGQRRAVEFQRRPTVGNEHLTDLGNGQRLVRLHGPDLRYVWQWGKWLSWDGSRWVDDQSRAHQLAKAAVLSMYREAASQADADRRKELIKHAQASEQSPRIDALLKMARSEAGIPINLMDLGSNPMLLNVENGTIDLTTGVLREHRRDDLITKLCPVRFQVDATCPTWDRFMDQIFAHKQELIWYVQKVLGYCLTGLVTEQMLPILWGSGANGKSTLLATVQNLLGDYAMHSPEAFLMAKRNESHPTERADLFGRRLVCAVETEAGRRLAESLVKQLTGGERLRARRMREDFWEFAPTHKLILVTNHQPRVSGTDHAIWRRLRLVPFTVQIPNERQDKHLLEKLKGELPGILNWCLKGCHAWQAEGLDAPQEVTAATGSYRVAQDVLGQFLEDACVQAGSAKVQASDLYRSYCEWCAPNGEHPHSQRRFGAAMSERGYTRYTNNGSWYQGVGLRTEATE